MLFILKGGISIFFLDLVSKMQLTSVEDMTREIMLTNEAAKAYGLYLSPEATREIIFAREHTLKDYGRIELHTEITQKIIMEFCASPYIQQGDYSTTIVELHELFHYLKNETDDTIDDDSLIKLLSGLFNHNCHGELELLRGRETERIINQYRFGQDYDRDSEEIPEEEDDRSWEDKLWEI